MYIFFCQSNFYSKFPLKTSGRMIRNHGNDGNRPRRRNIGMYLNLKPLELKTEQPTHLNKINK